MSAHGRGAGEFHHSLSKGKQALKFYLSTPFKSRGLLSGPNTLSCGINLEHRAL